MTVRRPTVVAQLVDEDGNPVGVTSGALNTSGAGGGGGGAVTVADGADVAQGTTSDLSSANTLVGILKNIKAALAGTGSLIALRQPAATATLTNTAASAANVANFVAANAGRLGLQVYNDSSSVLYLKYGTTASTTSFSVYIPANTQWEMPGAASIYTGRIDAIWATATGNARITELTA